MPTDRERVVGDPALLAAVRARYTGTGDVLDQLWWLEHPGEPTPDGVPDPAVALAAARRALYRAGAPADGAEAVARAEAGVARDREAARLALREASPPAAPAAPAAAVRAPRRVLVGAVVVALLVGTGTGFAVARLAAVPHPAALAVLDRPQREDDRPPASAPLPSSTPRSSLRFLASSLASGTALYGARTRDGRICLVAVVRAVAYAATCASERAFAASGLSLAFEVPVDPEDDSGVVREQEIVPSWSPDGTVGF